MSPKYSPSDTDRIPTSVFLPVLRRLINEDGIDIRTLAERSRIDESTLTKLLNEHTETMAFDHADALLCAFDVPTLWLGTELKETYYSVDLSTRRCAVKECGCPFVPDPHNPHQKYCSVACRQSAHNVESGLQTKSLPKSRRPTKGKHTVTCRHGHKRTTENTCILANGQIRCRLCQSASSRRSHKKKVSAK